MPQLSLYLSETEMQALQREAQAAELSLSDYARRVLGENRGNHGWPEGFFELYGSIDDEDFVEPPELDPALDGPRGWN